jgi:pimeloyl-ACP methyl ester carboxylesterase
MGPPLLLAHPLAFSKAWWSLDQLGARFDAVAVDLRGHGETIAEQLELGAMADDLLAVLDHIGWDRAVVGGTSLGAAAALVLALRHPERVSTLVQDLPGFGPGSRRDPARAERVAQALARSDLAEAARRITEGLSAPAAKAWTIALHSDWVRYPDPGPKLARAFRASASWTVAEPWPDALRALSMPVRLLALKGDSVHPWDVAETMARSIPNAALVPRAPSLDAETIARQWLEVLGG